ncbi:hypothetical protein LSCM1_05266 [Leishmania martiniquensis]|uniref:Alpha-type protein kinase domain-containing protein n=1 Tax=Leishmania martiniquensis TaxID=1580590 RepID=A0A836KST3_9TRYP|nr:hypothetical protein LSCM1_05266 [Leishmania martiniquensis]
MWQDITELLSSCQSASSSKTTLPNANVDFSRCVNSSSLRLQEEVMPLQSGVGFLAASGVWAPPLSGQRQLVEQAPHHKSDVRHRSSHEGSLLSLNGSSSRGSQPPESSLPLLPLLADMIGSHKEFFIELAAPSTPTLHEPQQRQGMSSSSAEAAQLPTPQSRCSSAPHALSPRSVPALGSFVPTAAVTGTVIASPTLNNLSHLALRGGALPESVSLDEPSVSSMARSVARLHRGRARGRSSAACDEDASGMGGCSNNDSTSQVLLPHITRPLTSVESVQGCLLTTSLPELTASCAANALQALSCSSSHTSMRREDAGPSVAPPLAVVIEQPKAVGQPPKPSNPVSLPTSMHKRGGSTLKSSSSPQPSRPAAVLDIGTIGDTEAGGHPSIILEASDGGCGTSILAAAPVPLTVEAAQMVPADDAAGPWPPQSSTALRPMMCESAPASPASKSAAITPAANAGPIRSDTFFPETGECALEAPRPLTRERASDPKHGSMQSTDYDNCATAAREVTGQQRHGDSIEGDDAAHPRRAKRRLKKLPKKGEPKRHKNSDAAGEGEGGVAGGALKPFSIGHRSDTALARKRERKRQLKHDMMKKMASEERRQYKAEHQRRRAAKKALRDSGAAASPHFERSDCACRCGSKQHHSSDPSVSSSPTIVATAGTSEEQLPPSSSPAVPQPLSSVATAAADPDATSIHPSAHQPSPGPEVEPSVPNLVGMASLEDLAATLSPEALANTCHPSSKVPAGGSSALADALQVRRCTSASGGGASVTLSATLSAKGMPSTPAPCRRRFLSDGASMMKQKGRRNSLLYRISSTFMKVGGQVFPLPGPDAGAESFSLKCDPALEVNGDSADNGEDDGGGGLLCNELKGDSDAAVCAGFERALGSNDSVPNTTPHPPVAAAGSGAAAILELKQQQKVQQRQRFPSPPPGTAIPAVPASMVETDGGAASVDVSAVSPLTACASWGGTCHRYGLSLPLRTDTKVSSSARPRLNQPRTGDALTAAAKKGAAAMSGSSTSCCSSRSRSRAMDEERAAAESRAKYAGGTVRCGAGEEAPTPSAVASAAAVAAARKARRSISSSCSSFRSRSSDDESADGSSGSSYSSYTSSENLVPEVLQLVEGCSVPPPAAAFTNLKYRYSCVPQLHRYAEPAILHEWDLTEGCWGSVETSVVISPQPFSQGNMRASYYMIDMRRLNCLLVAKRYLKSTLQEDQYFDDVSMHSIAGHWARVFNTMNPPKKVRFVPAAVLMLPGRNPPLILAMEPQLTGKFVKYNNNCGYVRRKARWTPQAFSHFTYHASGHELMVVDIQGVDDFYTDPQILSPDGEGYGRGNLGKEGIRRFLESHRCNEVCRAIGLPPLQRDAKGAIVPSLGLSGVGRGSSGPGTLAAKDRVAAAVPSASGLKEERLPPKAFTPAGLASSGNVPSREHNGVQLSSRQPSEANLMLSPQPPRQTLHTSSGSSSISPLAAISAPLTPLALPHRMSPLQNYGVKYMRCPRQALIRPQSQYFTSTIAGGLMAVPQQGSVVPNGLGNVGVPSALQSYSPLSEQSGGRVGGPPANGSSGATRSMAAAGGHSGASPSPQGPVMMAVPLLRPPAAGRPTYAGAQCSANPEGLYLLTAQRSGENVGSSHQPPHLRPDGATSMGGGMPTFYPHPPMTGVVGTPTLKRASRQSSSNAMSSAIQSSDEVLVTTRPGPGRPSFSRQPVFSAVEEMKSRPSSHRHHRLYHQH